MMPYKPEELRLVSERIIGLVLTNAEKDSFGNKIEPFAWYRLSRHIETNMFIIEPLDINSKTEFIDDQLRKTDQLN